MQPGCMQPKCNQVACVKTVWLLSKCNRVAFGCFSNATKSNQIALKTGKCPKVECLVAFEKQPKATRLHLESNRIFLTHATRLHFGCMQPGCMCKPPINYDIRVLQKPI